MPAWRAVRVVAERGGRGRSEALEAPFVGRDDELRLLKDLFHATARDRRVRLVSITGQAGIGKSRLAWEFLKYVDGLVETVHWNQGRSPSYGNGITFWALGEMVRERPGWPRSTTRPRREPGSQRPRLDGFLTTASGAGSSPPSWPSCGAEPPAGGRTSFLGLADVLRARRRRRAVVIVFEDLQWADSGLPVVRRPPDRVEPRRPDLRRGAGPAGAPRDAAHWGRATATSPVSRSNRCRPRPCTSCWSACVPGLPDDAARRIVVRADGVPLYAVEIVRMLVAQGSARWPAASTGRSATWPSWPSRDPALARSRHASTRWTRPTGPCSRRGGAGPLVHGRRARGRRLPSIRRCGASTGWLAVASWSSATSIRGPPSAASPRSSSRWSARSRTRRLRGAIARRATWLRPATSRRRVPGAGGRPRDALPGALPDAAEDPQADALVGQARIALARSATGR